ncbi:disease resistance-like protein DSC1 [Euphorbia lathyris]|uniref:disease resistance-like protein DSC1 n=1 Tax=Euphorbia lathyris TaxID=212925 RepID=UPI0033140E6F
MGGIGKTTIANAVFKKFASNFEGTCFLENIREASSTRQGLANKCDELVNKLLNVGMSNSTSNSLLNRLCFKKVFIVVDDVDNFEQLELLVGKHSWFGVGSRIIVTSRDKQVLQNKVDKIYEVRFLPPKEALHLFSLFAFKTDQPKPDYIELSNRVVSYVNGIPLALKVLGSFLYSKSEEEWESALYKLKTPNLQIQKVLMISYDGLDRDEQRIFLDIACFLKGWSLFSVTKIFDACGYSPLISLRVLTDKALITTRNSKVEMHDLLQEMGRQIVRDESDNDPSRRSRLWDPKDILYVLTENRGTEAIEGIFLDQSKISACSIDSKVFYRTKGLKWLSFYNSSYGNMQFLQGLQYLPNQLRLLCWDFCPLKSLPSNFQAENLVLLNMSHSPVEQLWAGVQNLANLAGIKLNYCRHLIELPDLSRAQNLLSIDCRGCTSLPKLSPSIGYLKKLVELQLQYCKKIKYVPSTKDLKSFILLDLTGCSNLEEFPEISSNIQTLVLAGTSIEKSSASIKFLAGLGNPSGQVCQYNLSMKSSGSLDNYCIYISEISFCLFSLSFPNKMNQSGKDLDIVPAASVVEHMMPDEPDSDIPEKLTSSTVIPKEMLQYERMLARMVGGYMQFSRGHGFLNLALMDQKTLEDTAKEVLKRVKVLAGAALTFSEKYFSRQVTDNYGSMGTSVTVQLPPNWFSSNFRAFHILAFLGFKDESEKEIDEFLGIRWKCQFKTECGKNGVLSTLYHYFPPKYSEDYDSLMYVQVSNSCLVLNESWFCTYRVIEVTFEASIEHSSAKPRYVVNKVGTRLMYLGDEEGNPPIFRPCCPDHPIINHAVDSNIHKAQEKEEPHVEKRCLDDNNPDRCHLDSKNLVCTAKQDDNPSDSEETESRTLPCSTSSNSEFSSQSNATEGSSSSNNSLKDRLSHLRSLRSAGSSSQSVAQIEKARMFLSTLLKLSLDETMESTVLKEARNSLQVFLKPAASNVDQAIIASDLLNQLSQLASTYEACLQEQESLEILADRRETLTAEEDSLETELYYSYNSISSTEDKIDNLRSTIRDLEDMLATANSNLGMLEEELVSEQEHASSKLSQLNHIKSSLAEFSELEGSACSKVDELVKKNENMVRELDQIKKMITQL